MERLSERIYFSIGDFARKVRVSTRTVERWIAQGKLRPAFRTSGGHYRFGAEEFAVVNAARGATLAQKREALAAAEERARFLSVRQLANELGVPIKSVKRWMAQGGL